jgi:hypothetical protein
MEQTRKRCHGSSFIVSRLAAHLPFVWCSSSINLQALLCGLDIEPQILALQVGGSADRRPAAPTYRQELSPRFTELA